MLQRLGRKLLLSLGPVLGYVVLKLLWSTYRVQVETTSAERLRSISSSGDPVVFAFWHDQIFASSPFLVKNLIQAGHPVSVMISPSDDGELVSRTIKRLGLTVVRGSASRGGAKALRALYRSVTKNHTSPVMLPDGPKGPQYEAKPGTVVLAQMTQKRIAPLAFAVNRAWTLGSWDAMRMPKPFATINVLCGEPYSIPRRLSDAEQEQHTAELQSRLTELRQKVDSSARS